MRRIIGACLPDVATTSVLHPAPDFAPCNRRQEDEEMSGAHEMLEKMEHAGHAGHAEGGHGGPGKMIGITMALLGVMLAFCAAMVGSARTELIRATVEQANLWSIYQAESTKYRVMEADYEMLHA